MQQETVSKVEATILCASQMSTANRNPYSRASEVKPNLERANKACKHEISGERVPKCHGMTVSAIPPSLHWYLCKSKNISLPSILKLTGPKYTNAYAQTSRSTIYRALDGPTDCRRSTHTSSSTASRGKHAESARPSREGKLKFGCT